MGKAKFASETKEAMQAMVLEHGVARDPLWEKAHLDIEYVAKDRRRRDLDNLIGASKAWIDGLVGFIIVDDSADRLTLSASYRVCADGEVHADGGEKTVFTITNRTKAPKTLLELYTGDSNVS